MFLFFVIVTAFLVGFAMKRGGLCTYVAAVQIVQQQRAERLFAFLGAAAWATIIVVPLSWWLPDIVHLSRLHNQLLITVIGGMVLGLGAFLNRGCFFGTFVQLVGGNSTYLATLLGLSTSVIIISNAVNNGLDDITPDVDILSVVATPTAVAFYWLFVMGVFALIMMLQINTADINRKQKDKKRYFKSWKMILIMITLGIGGGLLFTTVSGWDYASVLSNATLKLLNPDALGPSKMAIFSTIAMVVGGVYAAVSDGSFVVKPPKLIPFLNCFIGGVIMGLATVLIPGGNDGLLLKGIPSFAPHAFIGFFLMVLTMVGLVYGFRRKS